MQRKKRYQIRYVQTTRTDGFFDKHLSKKLNESLNMNLTTNKLLWQFINKDKYDSVPYYMGWARRIDKLPINLTKKDLKSCN